MNSVGVHIRQRFTINADRNLGFLLVYLLLASYFLRNYLVWQSINCLMGIMAFLVVVQPDTKNKGSRRIAYWVVVFSLLSIIIKVKTVLFFAFISGILLVIEQSFGKVNRLSIILTLFVCPFFQFAINVFGFPIRLWLTGLAGKALHFIGTDISVQGSVIVCRGQDFLVDTTCMGLKMLVSSLMLSIVILSVYETRMNKRLNWKGIGGFLFLVVLLNIIANLLRIVLIVQFAIMRNSILHEMVGILCFIVYIILPVWAISKYLLRKTQVTLLESSVSFYRKPISLWLQFVYIGLLMFSAILVEKRDRSVSQISKLTSSIPGLVVESLPNRTIKLVSSRSLIYLKRMETFFTPDHNPMICWKGSGFELSEVSAQNVLGRNIYVATLRNNNEKLYTAWWFDNGLKQTINQLDFRIDMLKGSDNYDLVNVTCSSRDNLYAEIENVFQKKIINYFHP